MTRGTTDPVTLLPHGPGFRFVSSIGEHIPGHSATGVMRVGADDPFVRDHFPGHPIVPGVLVTEALAQLAGIASHGDDDVPGSPAMLAHIDVRFGAAAVPPCDIALSATLVRRLGRLVVCEVRATCDGDEIARGEIVLRMESAESDRA